MTPPPGRVATEDAAARRRFGIGAAAAAAILLVLLAVPALRWQAGLPRLGFGLETPESGNPVVTSVVPEGTAAALGIQPGDTLLSVGRIEPPAPAKGRDRSSLFKLRIANEYRAGERAEWTVLRGGRRRVLSGSFVGRPDSGLISRVIVFGVFWALALFLLWARSDRKAVRHLAYTILALTASVLFAPNRWMPVNTPLGFTLHQVRNLGLFVAPALVVHFGVIFPVCTLSDRARRWVLGATYGLYFVAVYVAGQALFVEALGHPEAPYALTPPALEALHYGDVNLWLHIVDYLACGYFMFRSYRRVREEHLRDQIKWVLWAVLLTAGIDALGVGAALYLEPVGFGDLYPFRNYLYLLIAAGLLIAVFRHDLFDVDAVIRGSVVYFGTTGALFVLFAATEALLSKGLREMFPAQSGTVGTVSAAVLSGALFQPLRAWLQATMLRVLPVDPERVPSRDGRSPPGR